MQFFCKLNIPHKRLSTPPGAKNVGPPGHFAFSNEVSFLTKGFFQKEPTYIPVYIFFPTRSDRGNLNLLVSTRRYIILSEGDIWFRIQRCGFFFRVSNVTFGVPPKVTRFQNALTFVLVGAYWDEKSMLYPYWYSLRWKKNSI